MLDNQLLAELQQYVDMHRVIELSSVLETPHSYTIYEPSLSDRDLELFIATNRKSTFRQILFNLIDHKDMRDADLYKKAGVDRRHFSKIRSNPTYKIGKNTVIALALALELDEKETDELLTAAGFSLSASDTFDLVIQFFLQNKIYDIDALNEALEYLHLKPLSVNPYTA